MSAAPILNISKDGETIKSVSIEGEAELGRSEGCLIRLDDRAISRKHALFTSTPGGVQVEKKSDFAPLSVNGVECTRALLKEGDVIEIGPYLMRLAEQRTAAGASPVASPVGIPVPEPTARVEQPLDEEVSFGSFDQVDENAEPPSVPTPLDLASVAEPVALEANAAEQSFGQVPDLNFNQNAESNPEEIQEAQPPTSVAEPEQVVGDEVPVEIPSFEPAPEQFAEAVDGDAQTKLLPTGKLTASLEFGANVANVTHFELEEEASLGRGKACNIVLKDKKASRKHAIIRRQGSTFIIKDLESANGTFVNGVQITELQLSGDDVIRIGNTEFTFKALSQDYIEQQDAFLPVPQEEVQGAEPPEFSQPNIEMPFPPADSADSIDEIAGISKKKGNKKQTLVEKFRALPKRRQMIVGGLLLVLFYFVFIDDDTPPAPHPTQKIVDKGPRTATFETLTEEQKKFVISEHDLAFDYYKNREYDKTLFELNKIFALIPDYKDSRELERYSNEGKHKLEVMEEERRRKEEEERLRLRVADLVDQTKGYMDKKDYDKAHDFFPQILALDPDNAMVADWSKIVDRYEEQKAMEEQARAVQAQINRRAWDIYKEGMEFKKELKYQDAMATLRKVMDIGATDKKLESATKAALEACISELAALRDPVLADAKQAEDAMDLPKAYQLYEKSTQIDPDYPAGFAGMARIKGVLHDRAKGLYIEAVLAESYSDFTNSKKKFQECMQVAPKDDIYHERAERKLASYFLKNGDAAPQ
jgi:pSer/pThr/pTyr-binding forkhead associated (FHA) protein/tetratricopeptide (TPR) repeat protein